MPHSFCIWLSLSLSPVPPQILSSPADSEVEVGQDISLTCRAEGTSLSAITWTRDGTLLDTSIPRITISTQSPTSFTLQSVLLVSPAQLEDSGSYGCRASSEVGNSSASFSLLVTSEPQPIKRKKLLFFYNTSLCRTADGGGPEFHDGE